MRLVSQFLCLLVCSILAIGAADGPLLGDADFLPSPEQPVGYRGDHSGVFPGATPPLTWDERTGQGIAWRTTMPGYSTSTPIVVGDGQGGGRVFTMADPDLLVCCDAGDGKILWTGPVLDVMFPKLKDPKVQEEWRKLYGEEYRWGMFSGGNHDAFMQAAAKLLPKNDGLQACVEGKRTQDTKGGSTGQPIPLADTNHVGARTYEWYWLGNTFSPPVSDGKHVWAMWTYAGVVACYTLDGQRVWTVRTGSLNMEPKQVHHLTQEMLLYGDLLYVPGDSVRGPDVTVLDKRSGKVVKTIDQKDVSTGTGQVFSLATVEGEDYVILNEDGWSDMPLVLRAKDASIVGRLTGLDRSKRHIFGPNRTGWVIEGDVMYAGCGDYYFKKENGACAIRLTRVGDGLRGEYLWKAVGSRTSWRGVIKYGDVVFAPGHGFNGNLYAAADGKVLVDTGRKGGYKVGDLSKIYQLKKNSGNNATNNPVAAAGRIYQPIWGGVTAVIDARTGKTLAENFTEPIWGGSLFFHGARAYVRGLTSLYCLGK